MPFALALVSCREMERKEAASLCHFRFSEDRRCSLANPFFRERQFNFRMLFLPKLCHRFSLSSYSLIIGLIWGDQSILKRFYDLAAWFWSFEGTARAWSGFTTEVWLLLFFVSCNDIVFASWKMRVSLIILDYSFQLFCRTNFMECSVSKVLDPIVLVRQWLHNNLSNCKLI